MEDKHKKKKVQQKLVLVLLVVGWCLMQVGERMVDGAKALLM